MKRVHDYTGSTSPPENVSPPVSATSKRNNSNRKRKTGTQMDEMTEKRQKTANARISSAATAAALEQNRLNQERKNLMNEWAKRRSIVHQGLQSLQGPKDMNSHFQINEDLAALTKIASRLNELG